MRVLTIKQPYAYLISEGIKRYEFRTWKTNFRGEILIHASKQSDKKAMVEFRDFNPEELCGAIIAKATISDVIKVDNNFRKMLKRENNTIYKHVIEDLSFKGYAFKLENIQKIKPIYINGKLGLWNYDGEVRY